MSPTPLFLNISSIKLLAVGACVVCLMGCSRSKPSSDLASRPAASLEEVNQALVTWNLYYAAYPTNLAQLESAPFFKKRLPTPPPGEKLVLERDGKAAFVPE
jgi:hypothetical protein